jgi:ubiquinone/menaquinone biosynthesis C-methylase UbiE
MKPRKGVSQEHAIDPLLLGMLRSPLTQEPLRLRDGLLGSSTERYPVVDSIPILLPPRAPKRTPQRVGSTEEEIIEAFRERSSSYFRDNYQSSAPGARDRQRRHALVSSLLRNLVGPGLTVLEAGSGPAVLATDVTGLGANHVALDLSHENLVAARERLGEVRAVVGSLTALPFASKSCDVVTAIGCLEYVPAMGLAIRELTRVCRPDGFIVASFANRHSPRRWWDELLVHPAARLKSRLGGDQATYGRHLVSRDAVRRMFETAGATVFDERSLNGGLLGFPMSERTSIQRLERLIHAWSPRARMASSEFVVIARRDSGERS